MSGGTFWVSLARVRCQEPRADACTLFAHSWLLIPTPRAQTQDLRRHIRSRALGWQWWKEPRRLSQGLPKRQAGTLEPESLRTPADTLRCWKRDGAGNKVEGG